MSKLIRTAAVLAFAAAAIPAFANDASADRLGSAQVAQRDSAAAPAPGLDRAQDATKAPCACCGGHHAHAEAMHGMGR
jgi:hypothetical protein